MSQLVVPVTKKDHIRGNIDAPVMLVEYGDFECPYCGEAYPIIQSIRKEEGDTLCFVYRNFPLTEVHPHAMDAACAAEAAGKQGEDKFWQMHDILFENQDALRDENLMEYAKEIGLAMKLWTKDFQSDAIRQRVEDDFLGGVRSGVNATPTLFINNVRYDGEPDFDSLLAAIHATPRKHKGQQLSS